MIFMDKDQANKEIFYFILGISNICPEVYRLLHSILISIEVGLTNMFLYYSIVHLG